MPNIRISHIEADDWTDVKPPIACSSFVLSNADPTKGFSYRSSAEDYDSEIEIQPGFDLTIAPGVTMRPTKAVGQVKGGIISLGIGIGSQEVAES